MTLATYAAIVTAMFLGCYGVWMICKLLDNIADAAE